MKAKAVYKNGRRRQARRKQNWILIGLLLAGVLLVGAAVYGYAAGSTTAGSDRSYRPEDVAQEQPIVAVHEMAEGPPVPFLPRSQPQPKIVAPEKFYNFGRVGPQDVVERTFIIRNVGDAPLTISRAYTTCGCTTADISASVIPPGKVATVRLVFDAGFHDAAGQTVRRGLIIENNDPNQSQVEIWIQATVGRN